MIDPPTTIHSVSGAAARLGVDDATASTIKSPNAPGAAAVFGGYMDKAMDANASPQDKLRSLSKMYVSSAMIMPMFEQMRSDPLAANLFHGGRSEEVFQQQLDQVLSDRIAGASKFDLAEAIYKELSGSLPEKQIDTHV